MIDTGPLYVGRDCPVVMTPFCRVYENIKEEMQYQDDKFQGNDKKPLEVWLLIAKQYMDDALERYAHGTQAEARQKLLKAVTCGVRALMT